MWGIVFFVLPLIGLAYTLRRTWFILPLANIYKYVILVVMVLCLLLMFANFGLLDIDSMPMPAATVIYEIGNSSLFVMLYLVILYLLLDLGRAVHLVPHSFMFNSVKGSLTVLVIIIGVFTYGYLHYMDKHREEISLSTEKGAKSNTKGQKKDLKLVLASDLHIGYHNQVDELNRWIDLMNKENPDLILIGGDIIDGHMRPLIDQNMASAFHRLKAPVIACPGNHEYYTGLSDAIKFYKDAGITLLRDSAMTIDGINIIGRDDRTNQYRKSVKELTQGLDMKRYTILLDHQPYHLEEAEKAGIDFQFSGHTHYGQMWPISWITDAIYEDAFGPLQKGKTQYYVSSGLGIWGAKFRVGTRSEYVVAKIVKSEK